MNATICKRKFEDLEKVYVLRERRIKASDSVFSLGSQHEIQKDKQQEIDKLYYVKEYKKVYNVKTFIQA